MGGLKECSPLWKINQQTQKTNVGLMKMCLTSQIEAGGSEAARLEGISRAGTESLTFEMLSKNPS